MPFYARGFEGRRWSRRRSSVKKKNHSVNDFSEDAGLPHWLNPSSRQVTEELSTRVFFVQLSA